MQPHAPAVSEDDPTALNITSAAVTAATSNLASPATRKASGRTTSPTAPRRQRGRDLSSSIVSNLATARGRPAPQQRRGVPSLPEVSTQNAGGQVFRPSEKESPQSGPAARQSVSSSAIVAEASEPRSVRPIATSPSDEGFERFFSTFGNLFSKISPSLAFAALPLNPQASTSPSDQRLPTSTSNISPNRHRSSSRTAAAPATFEQDADLSTLISRPALRALRDEAGFPLTHESFYVVPPSGGTESYAGILRQRGGLPEDGPQIPSPILELPNDETGSGELGAKQRSSRHSTGSQDEFVDARESFGPPSPHGTRSSGNIKGRKAQPRSTLAAYGSQKTSEELEGENTALRQLLDTQSRVLEKQGKRLQMWEAQSQSQTAGLMAQSFMVTRTPTSATTASPTSAAAARKPPAALTREGSKTSPEIEKTTPERLTAEDAASSIAALEAKLAAEVSARQGLEKAERKTRAENAKLQAVVGKYRERWEVLKQGARERQSKKTAEESAIVGGPGSDTPRKGTEGKEKEPDV